MKRFISLLMLLPLLGVTALRAQQFTNYTTADGLPSDNVLGVAVDGSNNKWFATQSGVAKFNDNAWTVYTTANGLVDNYINCIAVDAANRVWAGTDYGVSRFDGTTWTTFTTTNGLVDDMVKYIAGDPDGSVWIGTGNGLSNFDGTTWKTYTTANGLPSNLISYIAVDSKGIRWFGTFVGGLVRFDGSAFTVTTMTDSLPSDNIICIAFGRDKSRWVGTYSGVAVYDSADHWVRNIRKTDGMFSNFVQDMAMDSRKTMWLGLYDIYTQDGGVDSYNLGFWKHFNVAGGLVDAHVKRLAVDANDYVWIATGAGVSKLYDPHSGTAELQASGLRLYPNPATTEIHADGLTEAARLEILTPEGRCILTRDLAAGSTTIGLSGIAPGLYLLKFTSDRSSRTEKLVIR